MSQTAIESRDEPSLEELLVDLESDPAELVDAIRGRRERAMGAGLLARDLDRQELRFLSAKAKDRRHGAELGALCSASRRASLHGELESLRATAHLGAAALFDLAELRAACRLEGMDELASSVAQVLEQRLAEVTAVDSSLDQEARERYAALATEEEDLSLRHKILLLAETRAVFERLATATGDRQMRRFARRLGRAECDRILAERLERALTRRGAFLLENLSLFLLIALMVLLLVESAFPISNRAVVVFTAIDASICVFFIAEFLFKLALAPARSSWFLRNALTDLLPALPAALWFVAPVGGEAADAVALVRAGRFVRIVWFARYVQALRPVLRLVRLVLFLMKGMDSLVRRFSPLMNRNFVFFEREVAPLVREEHGDERSLLFSALRREHVLLADLPPGQRAPLLEERARRLRDRLAAAPPVAVPVDTGRIEARDIPVEHAIEYLYRLRPEQISVWMPRNDILAVDRMVRVINAPLVRSLPVIRWLRSPHALGSTPEERVVELGRRVAELFERWRERVLHVADLHGIVTGPQVLDRIASAMVMATKRPAVRLLLFGGLFTILRMILGDAGVVGVFLGRFVATPLVVLGSVCLVLLVVGRWLKALAGQASDAFKLTSEAHFLGLLELVKQRHESIDLQFLARRVFRWDMEPWCAAALLDKHIRAARTGVHSGAPDAPEAPSGMDDELCRVALLYLHFLDGAVLHETDVKTTEQLLANLSLENIRSTYLGYTRREKKRLKALSLAEGSLFRGPYVWFRFITESVAVETAKRITDYNRNCFTLAQRSTATPEERTAFARWLRRRRRPTVAEQADKTPAPAEGPQYRTTEFNALDFLTVDPQREAFIERMFGAGMVRLVRRDRRAMVREIFGTRPLDQLPQSKRTLNFYRFYNAHLSRGRAFLTPLYAARMTVLGFRMTVAKTARIVGEILAPEQAAQRRETGRAPFAVALRKIHRMKAPTLLEAMRMRVAFDPAYCGAPPSWSANQPFEAESELERDLDFLMVRERDRAELRRSAEANHRRVEELHRLVQRIGPLEDGEPGADATDPERRRCGERAVTIAYMTNRRDLRTLFRAESWFEDTLVVMESRDPVLRGFLIRRAVLACCRGFRPHPVDRWLRTGFPDRQVSRRGRGNFKRAWHTGDPDVRETVRACAELPDGVLPFDRALSIARELYAARDDVSRELAALRAVQSLSVLDVRNYRKLVFEIGGYADDGEDPVFAEALP